MVKKLSLRQLSEPEIFEPYRYIPADTARADFICQVYSHTLHETYPIHWLEYYEIAIILAGKCIHAVNGKQYPIEQGTLFLLTPADFHTLIIPTGSQITIMGAMFDEGAFDDQLRQWIFSDPHDFNIKLLNHELEIVKNAFQVMVNENQKHNLGSFRLTKNALEQVLIYFARVNKKQIEQSQDRKYSQSIPSNSMHNALMYIHHHFRQPLNLKLVASQANLSSNYFSERFHEITGLTFQQHVQNLRLRFAAGLLAASNLPVVDVMMASGFNDPSHFGRTFKKQYQLTPRQFRLKNQTDKL
ncbi:MAG: hypothetical protein CL609_05310 [Anaerolineaceae bacterium]|nr:hypothetical protein [Anaerolineaceae bacterium]